MSHTKIVQSQSRPTRHDKLLNRLNLQAPRRALPAGFGGNETSPVVRGSPHRAEHRTAPSTAVRDRGGPAVLVRREIALRSVCGSVLCSRSSIALWILVSSGVSAAHFCGAALCGDLSLRTGTPQAFLFQQVLAAARHTHLLDVFLECSGEWLRPGRG